MRSRIKKVWLVISLLMMQHAYSQSNSKTGFKLFFEKVYLHTDKHFYLSGDNIWFKAYLVNPRSNQPTFTSNNLMVDLVNADGDLVDKEMIRLDQGVGHGDFKLPDSLHSGTYQLRAYTNWMKNFGNEFVFEKMIEVRSTAITKNSSDAKSHSEFGNPELAASNDRIRFFPEGGSLIEGVRSRIAFKAETSTGTSITVKGQVLNAKGETVASFTTAHAGMGSFLLLPQPNEHYEIKTTTAQGQSIASVMPAVHETGLALSLVQTDTNHYTAIISTNQRGLQVFGGKPLSLQAKQFGRLIFEDSVVLSGTSASLNLPLQNFLPGIVMVTLYDDQARPHCERMVFAQKRPSAAIQLKTSKQTFSAGEDVAATIHYDSILQSADTANLSMAVVDAGLLANENENLISYLLLESEIKGRIDDPAVYVDPNNPNRSAQLDLLLMTQGWREFLWTRLAGSKMQIHHLPESGITISGTVRKPILGKPLGNLNITLFAPQATGNKIYFTKTDSAGRYYLDGLNLMGIQRIKLVSKDDKGKKAGAISMDPLSLATLPGFSFPSHTDTIAQPPLFEFKNIVRLKQEEIKEILPNVTVVSNNNKTFISRDDVSIRFGYKDSVFTITDKDFKDFDNLENFLHARMPGSYINVETGGIYFLGDRGAQIRPRLLVDNREDVFDRLDYYSLPMNVISKVVVQHMISATTQKPGYYIYLTVKESVNAIASPELISTEINGYYEARDFYLPPIRTNFSERNTYSTLFWNPHIVLTSKEERLIPISNAGKSKYRIIVQGLTHSGTPLYATAGFEVR